MSPGCMQADFCESYVTMEPGVFYSAYPLPDGSYACLKVTVGEDGTMESQQEIPESEWRKQTKKTHGR